MAVFKPRFHPGHPLYPPKNIQIEVGDHPDRMYYKSRIFKVDQTTDAEQNFTLFPDLVTGQYIKVNLLGKPKAQ